LQDAALDEKPGEGTGRARVADRSPLAQQDVPRRARRWSWRGSRFSRYGQSRMPLVDPARRALARSKPTRASPAVHGRRAIR
jgi:hypothetical protein